MTWWQDAKRLVLEYVAAEAEVRLSICLQVRQDRQPIRVFKDQLHGGPRAIRDDEDQDEATEHVGSVWQRAAGEWSV